MRPNLFDFATKELSQDAFLAWLIQWASPECRSYDGPLWESATRFVKKLLSLQTDAPTEITSVKAGRQWENIDVWAEVNGRYLLIIEDKTVAGEHSNQLQMYKRRASDWCAKNGFRLVCVYLKTGTEPSSVLKKIEQQGFAVFTRRDLLLSLDDPQSANQIFNDFRGHLQALEDDERQFLAKPIKDWGDAQWRGFYQALDESRPIINGGYVPNPSGGFWNAVLNWHETPDCCPYMQIEQGPLCFKVGEIYKKDERRLIRDRYSEALLAYCEGNNEIRRPKRFGCGTYMTIAYIDRADWMGGDNVRVDVRNIVARLARYEDIFAGFVKKMQPGAGTGATAGQ